MKKLLLVPALFLLGLFFLVNNVSAQSCTCATSAETGNPIVISNSCTGESSPACIPDGCVCVSTSSDLPTYNPSNSKGSNDLRINSAIGEVPFGSSTDFFKFILTWAIGIGGGIAFLLIILASFMITTSSGNPERIKAGQELLTSAIAGLIMLVFSVFILKIIGVDILGILP